MARGASWRRRLAGQQGWTWRLQAPVLSLLGAFLLLFQPTYSLGTLGGWPQAWAACCWAGPPRDKVVLQQAPVPGWPLGFPEACGGHSGWPPGKGYGRRAMVSTQIGGRAELVLIHSACQSFESTERLPPLTVTHMGKPGVGSAWPWWQQGTYVSVRP